MTDARTPIYEFTARTIDGAERSLGDYRGKVLLIVNVASACGFTPQYAGLEALQRRFKDRGFSVLGFPCNQFGGQEPGSEAEIASFCQTRFEVSFPMFAKIKVNGNDAHPLFHALTSQLPGMLGIEAVKWNFTKFLVDAQGLPQQRYAPQTEPAHIAGDIEKLLARV